MVRATAGQTSIDLLDGGGSRYTWASISGAGEHNCRFRVSSMETAGPEHRFAMWFGKAVSWIVLLAVGWLHTAARGAQETPLVEPATGEPAPLEQPYFDLDAYLDGGEPSVIVDEQWHFQILPNDLIYKSYLAGVKEPRLGSEIIGAESDDWYWAGTLGSRVGLLRYGDHDPQFPQGFQVDVEAAAITRLYLGGDDIDVIATDYRVGVPLTWGHGRRQTKLAYYHMSSHLGDEFVLAHPGFPRLNWARDAIVLGHSVYFTDQLRVYAEVGWAFTSDVSEPWEFQVGLDYAPTVATGMRGAPFFAINAHVRQEVDFGGNFAMSTGWSWLSARDRHLMRLGLFYYNGKHLQYSLYDEFEQLVGVGAWYDF
ncbi:MAG: DUF1207 domain-containing protein [Planctomycetes bacterium]|nr:DUF1207 domain-containing protein [Planctomycetota bacterium]